jgi:hypothetical protein
MSSLYIAGPMRGQPLHGFPAFFRAALMLRALGHEVFNPAEVDMANGFNPAIAIDDPAQAPFDLHETLRQDAHLILECDGIVLLPGWEGSSGANFERVLAHYTGKAIYYFDESREDGLRLAEGASPDIEWPAVRTPRLWESLPGVKAIQLTLLDTYRTGWPGEGESKCAEVQVDVVDSETGEQLYSFGKVALKCPNHNVQIKLDAEVRLESSREAA